jgi:mRNA-degrading endonuclease YafQ of YafQ-DinJ toxin-antitoxin module
VSIEAGFHACAIGIDLLIVYRVGGNAFFFNKFLNLEIISDDCPWALILED